jgi:hypothetical protein
MLHLLIILCYCVYQNGMKVKQWEIQEEHTAHVLYICLRERTSHCKVVISWLSTIPRHLAQKRVEVFTEYCNLNNQSFKTEIMHQLNEHNKACHVICKQLLNLLQKIQSYWMHSWCQMRHISIQQVIHTNNIFNTRIQTTPADCKHPLHSLAYTWQCGVRCFPSALLALVSLLMIQNKLTDNVGQY